MRGVRRTGAIVTASAALLPRAGHRLSGGGNGTGRMESRTTGFDFRPVQTLQMRQVSPVDVNARCVISVR
jgi:hypothetical protein